MKKLFAWIKSITLCDVIQLIIAFFIAFALVSLLSCKSVPISGGEKSASYEQTGKEIQDILKHGDNLSPAQKIVLQHAAADLKDAQATSKQAAELQEKVIKSSEKAGAGKLVYWILFTVLGGMALFLFSKIKGLFGL